MRNPSARLAVALYVLGCVSPAGSAEPVDFSRDVRPILSEYCFACHGPDREARQADLRLDTRNGLARAGLVVPQKPSASKLIQRIEHADPEKRMPPSEFTKRPTAAHRKILAEWIRQGGEWAEHWAFVPPRRSRIPVTDRSAAWARNPIDHFVDNLRNRRGLEPSGEADRAVLARRVALHLTGMPPTPAQADRFLVDSSPDAFERFVARILASPAAAEHRARFWLDAARYGDTHGMHLDNYREIWPYRDWVIRAFATNMPFDQFVVEQVAGDLLPGATLDQRIATGFGRCNVTTAEGGLIAEEMKVRYMVDRVETVSTVFMGLTARCAGCHDHKYDPLKQRDFYRLGAFFNNTTQPANDGNQKDSPPVAVLPSAEDANEWRLIQKRRAKWHAILKRSRTMPAQQWWDNTHGADHRVVSDRDRRFRESLAAPGGPDDKWPAGVSGVKIERAGQDGVRFADGAKGVVRQAPAGRTDQPLTISFWLRTPDRLVSSTILDHKQVVDPKAKKKIEAGWRITSTPRGSLSFELTDEKGQSIRGLLPGDQALAPAAWQHVCVRYSGGRSNSSISMLVNGELRRLRNANESVVGVSALPGGPMTIGSSLATGGLGAVNIWSRWLSNEEVAVLAGASRLRTLRDQPVAWADLTKRDRRLVETWYRVTADPEHREVLARLAHSEQRRDNIYSRSITTLVMQEREDRSPVAWVLERGEYDQRREQVTPGVPDVLGKMAGPLPKNRLGLARWLVSPQHPLTARVTVNRYWQSVFGTGLVRTAEDLGVMGERPSHPELLDWLAVEFIESGWDVRHLLTLMVTSATYRQSSTTTARTSRLDPDNRLLSRGPRHRLDAEVLRDQALSVGGLLQRHMGGPGVRPYQPLGVWKAVAFAGSNTREYKVDAGTALHRRTLYTFWKRTSPPASMAAFDAPTREQCTVRRERTNTPLQALVLMNDTQYVEAARGLAQQVVAQAGSDGDRAAWLFRRALVRPPGGADVQELVESFAEFRKHFESDQAAAGRLIGIGDSKVPSGRDPVSLAAWTMVANLVMNRDDFLNVE